MTLFENWCDCDSSANAQKRMLKLVEKAEGRATAVAKLPQIMRSHYDDLRRIADDIRELGYPLAAQLLAERMPTSDRARSGELGEILATELVEEKLGYRIPVRRLRYKDGREMALRGDDFIGISGNANDLKYAKGESKSREYLPKSTITEARDVLARDGGRPTPTSILFVADRLLERGGSDEVLGRAIRNAVATQGVPLGRVEHILFTVSANAAPQALADDLYVAASAHPHSVLHLQISDHQAFIKVSYEEALKLGVS